jgi:hypothetical protein
MRAFCEAAEGIRTLDLLHGKQNVLHALPTSCLCIASGRASPAGLLLVVRCDSRWGRSGDASPRGQGAVWTDPGPTYVSITV